MVEQYEAAGISGVVIEDKLFPKVNSFVPGRQELANIPEFCGKLEAAKDARKSDDFLIIARIEALIAGWGMAEALKRAEAYRDAGADSILIHSKSKEPDEIREFLKAWNRKSPVVLIPTTYPAMTYDEMAKAGVNMIIFANQCMRASIHAVHDALAVMQREKSTVSIEKSIATVKEIFELQGMMKMKEHEKKYLRTGKTVHVVIPAAGVPKHEGKMAEMLRDLPVAMLPAEGKPLIQRIIESVNQAGMQDVTVLTGYKGDQVTVEGADKRVVKDFADSGILHSIEQAKDKFTGSVLIHYGDVIVSPENLRSFIAGDDPITVFISPLHRTGRYSKKKFDLVTLSSPPVSGRTLERHPKNALKAIGTDLSEEKAYGEFVGLVLLNQKGISDWNKTVGSLPKEELKTLSLARFLQRLIDEGVAISTFEARTGWAEVHSSEDYEELIALLRNP
jgi:phosphoenolpyruvate phosphomutase